MAGFKIEIKAEGLSRALNKSAKKCRELGPVWGDIGQRMLRSVGENFKVGGRPEKWEPLSPITLMKKVGGFQKAFVKKGTRLRKAAKKRILGNKILVESGRLVNSLNYKIVSDGVEIGTNLIYSAIHQFGGRAGRGHSILIPARPYLLVQAEDEAYIANAFERHIVEPLQ